MVAIRSSGNINMDTPFDSLASLNLDGDSGQIQPSAPQDASATIQPTDTQSADPWSDIVNATPTSDANAQTAETSVGRQDRNGLCQQFVEEATYGKGGIYPTASAAWNTYVKNGQAFQGDVSKAPPGTLIYFAPDASNGDEGHVGIALNAKGDMISATDNGIEVSNVADWEKTTGQKSLGYVKP